LRKPSLLQKRREKSDEEQREVVEEQAMQGRGCLGWSAGHNGQTPSDPAYERPLPTSGRAGHCYRRDTGQSWWAERDLASRKWSSL
jgi:hypothetical protein